jgi:hypothetical protein
MEDRKSSRPHPKTLRVQANVLHTFGALLIPLAVILVFCGGFMLEGSIAHPLQSDAISIISGSVVLASGLLLAAILLRSARTSLSSASREKATGETERLVHHSNSTGTKVLPNATPGPRPFHGFYVDETRVSR